MSLARVTLFALLGGACRNSSDVQPLVAPVVPPVPQSSLSTPLRESTGQSIYVPVYSHIYVRDETRIFELTVTLSVRNTDSNLPIVLSGVHYYATDGALLYSYLESPLRLGPLASVEYVVRETDTRGGAGANFIVDWTSEQVVSEPVVEAVMVGTQGQQGISFLSPGRVVGHHSPRSPLEVEGGTEPLQP